MKRVSIACALALSLSLLTGCMPGVAVTSPKDEEFQKDWADSMEEAAEDWAQDWETAVDEAVRSWSGQDEDGVEKDHYWKILDVSDEEAAIVEVGTVTDPEQVRAIDDLLNDDGHQKDRPTEDPGDPAYSYVYCQQETLKAGQDPGDREYEELVRFTVSASEDVVTMVILEDLPSLLNVDLGDFLTFTIAVPAETAEALRNPGQFLE
ncbi:hypothetical protein [uncultured Oscillibacter sp.]|uniref:hypothetical protein n=1 Tax=uncultured Oscillibacter sp. TaxID=876091 RepID=UPI0025D6C24F|nr:hypothetical protein [uncultured Oscillibacter sp.]